MTNNKNYPQMGPGGKHRRVFAEKPKKTRKTIRKLYNYIKKYRVLMLVIFVLVAISTISNLLGTRIIGLSIDRYIVPNNFSGLKKAIIFLMIIYIINSVSNWLQILISVRVSQNTVFKIRKDLFEKLQSLPIRFFDSTTHGEVMSRVTNDVDNIGIALDTSISQVFQSLLTIIGTFFFMVTISPTLTLVSFISIFLLLLVVKTITKFSKIYFKQQQVVLGELNGKIEEYISGEKVIKSFVKEEYVIDDFAHSNDKLKDISVKAQIFGGITGPVGGFFNNFSYGLVVAVGAVLALNNMIEIGALSSFLIYVRHFSRPFNELTNQYSALISALAGAERVFEIMETELETPDKSDAYDMEDCVGNVEFKNVTFGYEKDKTILKDINLYAKNGQTIALVGPTGSGKTTIINLLTRFYDISQGEILIDGHNINDIKRESLLSCLGIVLQDTYLFTGTVMENVRYGRLDATDEEVYEACKLAKCHGFIKRLSDGYNTVLTENADSLSQGQKQMIAIARAILKNPTILILDEATSNVDTRTEVKIQKAMLNLMEGRTSFVIAHRLSTIKNADMIAVIKDGEIIERGNHKELIKKKGFYYNLYMTQFSN